MNNAKKIPPGYYSIQDFLLHYHKRVSPQKEGGEKKGKTLNRTNQPVELCVSKKLDGEKPDFLQGRIFYERSVNSSILPNELPKPDTIEYDRNI